MTEMFTADFQYRSIAMNFQLIEHQNSQKGLCFYSPTTFGKHLLPPPSILKVHIPAVKQVYVNWREC